jgi:hypothetical protein
LTTKKPEPSIAMSVGFPVGSIEPGEKSFSMLATCAPRPRWLGFVPPEVRRLAVLPPCSVT